MSKGKLVAQLGSSCAALLLETPCAGRLLQTSKAQQSQCRWILKAEYINTSKQWTCQYWYVLQCFVSAPPAHSPSTLGAPSSAAQQLLPHTGHTNAATAKLPSQSISTINNHSSSCCPNHNFYLVFDCIMCSWFTRHYLRMHTNNSSLASILPIRASKQATLILFLLPQ